MKNSQLLIFLRSVFNNNISNLITKNKIYEFNSIFLRNNFFKGFPFEIKKVKNSVLHYATIISFCLFGITSWSFEINNPTVFTDKQDYFPGETVIITGANWQPGETVQLVLTETPLLHPADILTVIADSFGAIYNNQYVIQLHDLGQSFILVATGLSSGLSASVSFTDSDGSINKVYQHWADGDQLVADWNGDILSDNKSNYFEGQVIPHVFVFKASNNTPLIQGNSYCFKIVYNYYQSNTNAGGFAYITTYNTSRTPAQLNATNPYITPTIDSSFTGTGNLGSFYTVDADIVSASNPVTVGTTTKDQEVIVEFIYTGATTTNGIAEIYYGLYIANPSQIPSQGSGTTLGASAWSGGSLQTTIEIGQKVNGVCSSFSGATSIQLAPSAIIQGVISGIKYNDLNGNGNQDSGDPILSGWSIYLDSNNNGVYDASEPITITDVNGKYSFSVIPENSPYYIREIAQTYWTQTEPAGTNSSYGPFTVSAATPLFANNDFGNFGSVPCSIEGATDICKGSTNTYSGTNPIPTNSTYKWTLINNTNSASISGSDNLATVSVVSNSSNLGGYTVRLHIEYNNGLIKSDCDKIVVVAPLPTATISGTTSICSGSSATITFNGTANATVTYTINGGANQTIVLDATGTNSITTPILTQNSTYALVSVSSSGTPICSQSVTGSAIITVVPLPTASTSDGSQTICETGTATVSGASSSNGTILWTHNGSGSLSNETTLTPTYTAAAGDAGNTVTLTMTVSNSPCADATASYTVIVKASPTASAGGTATICETGTATVSGASSSNGTIIWTQNGSGSLLNETTLTPTYTAAAGDAGNTVTLTMTVSNSPCADATASYTVIVKASPTASAGGTATICETGTATVSGASSSNGTILWTHSGSGSLSNETTLTPTYTAVAGDAGNSVTLTMTVSNSPCADATASYTVIVKASPTASAGGTATICETGTATVSGATATNGTILWTHSGSGSLSNETTLTPTYTAAAGDAGKTVTLTMTVSNSPCTDATASYTVIVKASPTASAGGTATICETGTATVSGASSSNGTILWTHNGSGTLSNETTLTPTYTAVAGDAGNTVTLTMTVSNSPCADATASYTIIVKASPTASAGGTATICETGTATVSGASSSNGTILWTHNGSGSLSNETTLTPTYTAVAGDAGNTVTLTMTVSNSPCADATASYTVIVKASPTASADGSQTICETGTATVSGASSSNGTILWTHNGSGSLSNETTLTPTYTAVAGDAGKTVTLTMTVSNSPCADATASYTVIVKASPTASAGGTATICETGTATVSGASSSNGTILWTHSGSGSLSNETTLTPTYTAAAGDAGNTVTLTMTVSNSPCADATASYTVIVKASPTASSGGTATICETGTATVSGATATNGTILWTHNGSGLLSNETTLTPTYTAAAAGDAGNTVTLTMTVSNSPCADATASYTVIVKASPTASAGGTATICETGTATVSGASSSNGTILWTHNGSGSLSNETTLTPTYTAVAGDAGNSVTLTMTVSNSPCADATASYTVIVKASPTASAGGTATICETGTATVSGASSSNGTILWTHNGSGSLSNETTLTPTYTAVAGDAGNSVTLTMTVSNSPCADATASYTVIVKASPTAKISGTTSICTGSTAVITFDGTANATVTYTINGGSNQTIVLDALGTNSVTTPVLTENSTYALVSVSSSGTPTCSQTVTGSAIITVAPLPICSINVVTNNLALLAVSSSSQVGTISTFTGPIGNYTYDWSIINNTCGANFVPINLAIVTTNSSVSVNTLSAGTYTISLKLVDVISKCFSICDYTMTVENQNPFYTYTQGYYSSTGKSCTPDGSKVGAISLIQYALDKMDGIPGNNLGQLYLGKSGASFSMNYADAAILVSIMPGGGTAGKLVANYDLSSSTSYPLPPLKKGKIDNILLSQTITLTLNASISGTDFSGFILKENYLTTQKGDKSSCPITKPISCTSNSSAISSMKITSNITLMSLLKDKPISELLKIASAALGGNLPANVSYSDITNAVDVINKSFDEGRFFIGYYATQQSCSSIVSRDEVPIQSILESETANVNFDIYPIPFKDFLTIKYKFDYTSDVKIEVYNIQGIVLFSKVDNSGSFDKEFSVDLNINKMQSQMYFVKVTTNRGSSVKKIISGR